MLTKKLPVHWDTISEVPIVETVWDDITLWGNLRCVDMYVPSVMKLFLSSSFVGLLASRQFL